MPNNWDDDDYDEDDITGDLRVRTKKERTYTCNDCGSTGSLRWMDKHDCETNQELNENGGRCEDYPCCGHTDGDGCYTLESHTKDYWTDRLRDLADQGYDDYEIDMMFSRED